MAGNAALASERFDAALDAFNLARADAKAADNRSLAGEIDTDRARALVGQDRVDEAAAALARARQDAPQNAETWLLSATLARRQEQLDDAQAMIDIAAKLAPQDTAIGVEAGLIAALAGHDDAARRSWQSVIEISPKSVAADNARDYLAQLDEMESLP